ncbi:hypothetical protein E4U39_000881 [Claviceps sp. Clav50 group G5]|nr:hypothetical protein E4U39_000881 [Claviceps sp. Clav50 group G5]
MPTFKMVDHDADLSDHASDDGDENDSLANLDDDTMADVKKQNDAKDAQRPRRKKARRACFACQRAHLTCGDERPCQRCIKRGLADGCRDGVRKKAKYLHDAPLEALAPVLGHNYDPEAERGRINGQRQLSIQSDQLSPGVNTFLQQSNGPAFPVYHAANPGQVGMAENMSYNTQAPGGFPGSASAAGPSLDAMMPGETMDLSALFDPNNPSLYNFDLEGLNFGSQYAGWEFGILNRMGLAAETSPQDNSMSATPSTDANYAALFGNGSSQAFDTTVSGSDYSGFDATSTIYSQGNLQHGLPHAYAIAAGPNSLASPGTDTTASPQTNFEASPHGSLNNAHGVSGGPVRIKPKQDKISQILMGKRKRDSASVYANVKEPYPYTAGFHNMISVIKDRLPANKLVMIARSLGEIRPSFIACTKDLTREDLVFMEKCFQRTLFEFDDFLQHCCAPTIVCRRSGEVAAVNKEFTALTGWTKEVLLGQEPNRNILMGAAPPGSDVSADGTPRSDPTTSQSKSAAAPESSAPSQPRSVFLAELLDDDSVVQFYQDFAQLAFEDSRGKVQRSCRLFKYRTQDMVDGKDTPTQRDRTGILSSRVTKIDSEHGISRIEKDGRVNCTYCWTIKRDVFDIPMMIIMNFLPRYYPNQEPHQLAV